MGMYHSTYFAYGVRIPDGSDTEELEDKLRDSGVGFLLAGSYDRDMTFLVTQCKSVDLGSYEVVLRASFDCAEWSGFDAAIRAAAEKIGVKPIGVPGWFVVPDVS